MSPTTPSESLKEKVGDVPIHTSTRVLGAKVRVDQLQQRCEMFDVRYPLSKSRDTVRVESVGSDAGLWHGDRRYISAWARRTLFSPTDHGGDNE